MREASGEAQARNHTRENVSVLRLCFCLIFLVPLTGCEPAPMTNTVIAKAQSPDGKWRAILAYREIKVAMHNDEYFLTIIPSNQQVNEAITVYNLNEPSAFVATWAESGWANKVQLRWQSNDTLLVICDSCGLTPEHVEKKLDHIGPTKIIYQGVPNSPYPPE